MTEAELLAGITDALTIAGWRWMHIIRSDGVTQGHSGWVDVTAVHPTRALLLLWELKGDGGVLSHEQVGWIVPLATIATRVRERVIALAGPAGELVDARVLWPADYDTALALIVGKIDRWPD